MTFGVAKEDRKWVHNGGLWEGRIDLLKLGGAAL